ncbi:hypothetical protein DV735_g1840, partial [Chaetothyriales sp. CBS 134920]
MALTLLVTPDPWAVVVVAAASLVEEVLESVAVDSELVSVAVDSELLSSSEVAASVESADSAAAEADDAAANDADSAEMLARKELCTLKIELTPDASVALEGIPVITPSLFVWVVKLVKPLVYSAVELPDGSAVMPDEASSVADEPPETTAVAGQGLAQV